MSIRLLALIFVSLLSLSALAEEVISFNVRGVWYRGRIPENKISFVDDINEQMSSNYNIEDIQEDIEKNGCLSPFVQASVKSMLRIFGNSRRVIIHKIETNSQVSFDFSEAPCSYVWRGGPVGVLCLNGTCVDSRDTI